MILSTMNRNSCQHEIRLTKQIAAMAMFLVVLGGCATDTTRSAAATDQVDEMSWLSGCWISADESTREVWSEDFDGMMFGYSVTWKDAQVSFFEQLRIEPHETGRVYLASPRGTGTTAFTLTDMTHQSALFENPEHDFPQRLLYRRQGNQLAVNVSTLDQSRGFQVNFHPCD